MFHFSMYHPNSCKHLSHHTPVWPHEGIDRCDCCTDRWNNTATRSFLINSTFSSMSKLFTPIMCCWSSKILDGSQTEWHLHCHFLHSKRITHGCSLWDDFNGKVAISYVYKWRHSDVIIIKLIARTQNQISYKMYILEFS